MSRSCVRLTRGPGIALAAVGLMMLVTGPIIRLHLRRTATYLVYLGFRIGLAAVVWFVIAYPDNRVRRQGFSKPFVGL